MAESKRLIKEYERVSKEDPACDLDALAARKKEMVQGLNAFVNRKKAAQADIAARAAAEEAATAAAAAANSSVETRRTESTTPLTAWTTPLAASTTPLAASTSPSSPSSPSSRRRSYDFASATVTPGPFRQGIFFLDAPVTAPPGGWATIEAETRFHPDEGFTAKILSTRVERG